ncbi:extracellular solute-binding protein [Arenibacterium sp. LLYu02]|uniref:extracellular solute-binding protein n=1 Tax=Arenibacterium sp. LLYu02 TaxID=3404132 RepID=UPI003B20DC1D
MVKTLHRAGMALAGSLILAAGAAFAEPVPIRIVLKDLLTSNPQDVAHIDRIEAALQAQGVDVDLQIVDMPASGYADALGIKLLSGDIPDIIYFQGGDLKMAEQGILEDLTPYIEQSTWLKSALWPHNVERLKHYPYLLFVQPLYNSQPVIRQSWLDKAGVGSPQTLDAYVELMTAIRDGDFDGNGAQDTYAITTADTTAELDAIFNRAFGINATWLKDQSGAYVHSRVSAEEKEKLAFYAMLTREGLFDPEYVSSNWEVKEDKFYSGRAGVIFSFAPAVYDIYQAKLQQLEPGAELALLEAPEGPGGKGLMAVDVSKESRGFAIAATSEHKDLAFKVLDFLASPEGQMMERMGFEGEEYTREGDTYTVTDKIGTWYSRFFEAANWQPPVEWNAKAGLQSIERMSQDFTPDNAFVWPPEYAADLDATENVYRSWVYQVLSGSASLDQWEDYVADWQAAGGQRLTDYARSVLN